MMAVWLIPNEDEYWEHVRESLEAPRKNEEPYLEEGTLFLDDEIEELEKKVRLFHRGVVRGRSGGNRSGKRGHRSGICQVRPSI